MEERGDSNDEVVKLRQKEADLTLRKQETHNWLVVSTPLKNMKVS